MKLCRSGPVFFETQCISTHQLQRITVKIPTLMPMTHLPEIGAKTCTGFRRVWHAIRCRIFLAPLSSNE